MEFLRRVFRPPNPETAQKDPFPYPAQKYFLKGKKLAKKHKMDSQLQLEGHDLELLHLILGLRVLYGEIETSKIIRGGNINPISESVYLRFDSPSTLILMETETKVRSVLEEFVADRYTENPGRALVIQNAVNILFAANYDENGLQKPWKPKTIAAWAGDWRNRIRSTGQSTNNSGN